MNYIIDGIFILCLVWGAYKGFKKGFIIQSFAIFAIVLAIWCAFAFAGKLEPFMQKYFHFSELGHSVITFVLSFIFVFLMVLVLVYASGHLVSKAADVTALGLINCLAGAAFGILANALILSVFVLLFNKVNDKKKYIETETLKNTHLYEPIGKVAPAIFPERFFKKLLE